MNNTQCMPPRRSRRRLALALARLGCLAQAAILCAACASGKVSTADESPPVEALLPGTIRFVNPTGFTVHLVRGSGRTDAVSIAPHAAAALPNAFAGAETYYPLFDIPLTEDWLLSRQKPEGRDDYYQIDNHTASQEIQIRAPAAFADTSAYIIVTNSGSGGGVFVSKNESTSRLTAVNAAGGKSNINSGETLVFREQPGDLFKLRLGPSGIEFGAMAYRGGFVYRFDYNGTAIALTDMRPLHRVTEAGWVASPHRDAALDAEGRLLPAATPQDSGCFAASADGLYRHSFTSGGTAVGTVRYGDAFAVSFAGQSGSGVLLAGYAESSGGRFTPIARTHGADGSPRGALEPSARQDCASAYFLAAAHQDGGLWLLAGGADSGVNAAAHYRAYTRLVRETDAGFVPVWERAGADFDGTTPGGPACGPAAAAAYDPAHDRWLLAGNTLRLDALKNAVPGSYLAVLDGAGTIQSIDTSFDGFSINRILLDAKGAYYLAGEERRGKQSIGALAAFNAEGVERWRLASAPPPDSFYQDAVLDAANGRIVLAGTMRAKAAGGSGGTPFIDAVSTEHGALLWREELSGAAFSGAALAGGIALAPDYGFLVTLSGIARGYYAKPFLLARLNSQGKLWR